MTRWATAPGLLGVDPVQPLPDGEPLSAAQRGMWVAGQLHGSATPFVVDRCWRLGPGVDRAALREALRRVVGRHEALCGVVVETADGPVQVLPGTPPDPWCDAPAAPPDPARALVRAAMVPEPDGGTILFLRVHHLACDAAGLAALLDDLGRTYAALTGEPGAGPEPSGVPDFRDWLRAHRTRVRSAEAEAEQALAHHRAAYRLPAAHVSPAYDRVPEPGPGPAEVRELDLGADVVAGLDAFAARHRATAALAGVTAVAMLLRGTTAADELVVGLTVAGPAPAGLVGHTSGLVPVRVDTAGADGPGDVLDRVRGALPGLLEHGWLPVEDVLDRVGAPVHRPPFGVVVSWVDARSATGLRLGAEPVVAVPAPDRTHRARTDLTVVLTRTADGLHCRLEFDAGRYRMPRIEHLTERFRETVTDVALRPDEAWAPGDRIGRAERGRLLDAGRGPVADRAPAVPELIARRVRERPSAVAVVGGGARMTYAELWRTSGRIAAALRTAGVRPGGRAGLFLSRTPWAVAALLGVWRARAAYVPLDPQYPPDRIRHVLDDARPPVVLTERRLCDRLAAAGGPAGLCLEDLPAPPPGPGADGDEGDERDPSELSHVIYTSGSTGRPKGIEVEHGGVANLVAWALRSFPERALRGVLASTSLCFDLSVFEIAVPLAAGGTVVLVDDLLELADRVPAAPVGLVNTVPSVLSALLADGGLPPGTEIVNLAGEPLPPRLVRELHDRGVPEVRNLYAPSETTTYSTWCTATADPEAARTPIGSPLDNTVCRVLDADGRLVGTGVEGELYLGGAGVTRGYAGRPGETASRFLPDPWSTAPGARLYRTGDRARWREDGMLEFLGRRDQQVKVRGHRIELGDVESALHRCTGVGDACCDVRPAGGEDLLVAFVTPETADPDAVRAEVTGLLPSALVPSRIVPVPALPRSPSGKLDRAALSLPAERAARPAPPVSGTAGLVRSVWARVLGLAEVDEHRNFFDLGGTSLGLLRVRTALREHGVDVGLTELFRHTTVTALAARISAGEPS